MSRNLNINKPNFNSELIFGLLTNSQEREFLFNRSFSMHNLMGNVKQFHRLFGQLIEHHPAIPIGPIKELRKSLISEESRELQDAMNADDMVEIADGIADLIYVLIGTAISYGIPLEYIWGEVQRSNIAKAGGGVDANGKAIKPAGWTPPDIAAILALFSPESGKCTTLDTPPSPYTHVNHS